MKTYRSTKIISESRPGRPTLFGGWLIHVPFTPALRLRRRAGASVRIRGRWLEEAGFDINDQVKIHVEPGKLTLTKDS